MIRRSSLLNEQGIQKKRSSYRNQDVDKIFRGSHEEKPYGCRVFLFRFPEQDSIKNERYR